MKPTKLVLLLLAALTWTKNVNAFDNVEIFVDVNVTKAISIPVRVMFRADSSSEYTQLGDEVVYTTGPGGSSFTVSHCATEVDDGAYRSIRVQMADRDGVLVGNSYVFPEETVWSTILNVTHDPAIWEGSPFPDDLVATLYIDDTTDLGREENPDARKTLWRVALEEGLDGTLYAEGVDKIVWKLEEVKEAVQAGGGGGGGAGMTAEEFALTDTEAVAQAQLSLMEELKTPSEIETESNTARATAEAAITQAVPTLGSVSEETSAPSLLSFTSVYIGTISVDPADHPTILIYCNYAKLITGWFMTLAFAIWAWMEFKSILGTIATMNQARGNTVAGTGGQITGLAAAGIILAIIIGVPVAYWTVVTTDFSSLNSNPFTASNSYVQAALYLLALVFPYQLALALIAQMFVIRKAGTVIVIGVMSAIKFVVP